MPRPRRILVHLAPDGWRWTQNAGNGEPIAVSSEAYDRRRDAVWSALLTAGIDLTGTTPSAVSAARRVLLPGLVVDTGKGQRRPRTRTLTGAGTGTTLPPLPDTARPVGAAQLTDPARGTCICDRVGRGAFGHTAWCGKLMRAEVAVRG